jgi:hypothetical protein
MKMICDCIQDIKTIQNGYPEGSRGYESLRFAIIILERALELKEEKSPHWVLGETGASGTVTVEPEGATFSVEYRNA